ncbi:hypothetical protein IAT40_000229 [Kwoniella sp. CBS 6097]
MYIKTETLIPDAMPCGESVDSSNQGVADTEREYGADDGLRVKHEDGSDPESCLPEWHRRSDPPGGWVYEENSGCCYWDDSYYDTGVKSEPGYMADQRDYSLECGRAEESAERQAQIKSEPE